MVEGHAEGDARTSIVAGHRKAFEAELPHHVDHILAHGTERVGGMVLAAVRLGAVAVAAKIGRDDREALRKLRCDTVPTDVGQRIAVDQEERRAGAAYRGMIDAPSVSIRWTRKPGIKASVALDTLSVVDIACSSDQSHGSRSVNCQQ